jgi:glucokinase
VSLAIGVDLGGTQIKAAAFSANGELLHQRTAATEDASGHAPPAFARNVRTLVAELESALGTRVERLGVSAPGLVARDGRSIGYMPGRMHGLENFDWSVWLERPVPVVNDAHAALLGEVWQGAARGLRDAILLTLGTGVGGAIWADGRLLRGHLGRAGHLGHLCLDPDGAPTITGIPGGLENWIGNHNIGERTGGRFATTHELVAAYESGDTLAAKVWLRSLRGLGCAIASLVNVLDPEAVILGGGIARAGHALFEPLQRVLDEVEWRPADSQVRLLPAMLGEWAGAYGAAFAGMGSDRATRN